MHNRAVKLSPLATNPPSQLNVLGHDRHALGVDGAQVGVLEQTHQVCFRSLLQGKHRMALETQISLEILGNLPNKPLEWKLPYEQVSALLVLADFTVQSGISLEFANLVENHFSEHNSKSNE